MAKKSRVEPSRADGWIAAGRQVGPFEVVIGRKNDNFCVLNSAKVHNFRLALGFVHLRTTSKCMIVVFFVFCSFVHYFVLFFVL
jgi:hypothetical protein